MGHHCGCFVCENCKELSSSHYEGTIDNRLCPKCAREETQNEKKEAITDEISEEEQEIINETSEEEIINESSEEEEAIIHESSEEEPEEINKKRKFSEEKKI